MDEEYEPDQQLIDVRMTIDSASACLRVLEEFPVLREGGAARSLRAALRAAGGQEKPNDALRFDHAFIGVAGHEDDDECTHRADGTDATYCGHTEAEHDEPATPVDSPFPFPCCEHCGCEPRDRVGHDDSCANGCNDVAPVGGQAEPSDAEGPEACWAGEPDGEALR